MIVSLVSGTYNRLQYLQRMVQSFRESIGVGIPYEIILVDGGSDDGTISWCLDQIDIKFIEQGKLLGAVKAFNEGALAANGKYVILANDDIEFLGDSVIYAIRHMEDNTICGIGCFFQNRNNKAFHVEQMPAIKDGKQISYYYGQVCIVRREIGDEVGWWGDYLHTYGGDNELSCNVLEKGYDVQPIVCACVNDVTPQDKLRKINNDVAMVGVGNNHPDTQKWLNKWTKPNGMVGPDVNINSSILSNNHSRCRRFLYLPIYEYGNVKQHQTKTGLRDALAREGLVYEIDYVHAIQTYGKQYFMEYMIDILDAFNPDIIITQLHGATSITINDLHNLKKLTHAIWVNWNGDYHPEHLYDITYMMLLKLFDVCGFVVQSVKDKYDAFGINWFYWQIGYEGEDVHNVRGDVKQHDVILLANGYSKERQSLAARLRGMSGVNVGLYGYWDAKLKPDGECLYDFDLGYKLYSNAKIAISDSQWPEVVGYCSNRLFQAMFSGVCLFQQRFDGMKELLGLEHGKNCIVWHNVEELEELIQVCMNDIAFTIRVGENGKRLAEERHSFDHRVKELLEQLQIRELI